MLHLKVPRWGDKKAWLLIFLGTFKQLVSATHIQAWRKTLDHCQIWDPILVRYLNLLNPFLLQQRHHGLKEIILEKHVTLCLANNMHLIHTVIRPPGDTECLLCTSAYCVPEPVLSPGKAME